MRSTSPPAYTPDRAWPILYAFDARGQALVPAKAFQEAAEKYGWIVASSYNSASDGLIDPNFAAMRALWADTHARFAIDDQRVYAAGFSGTVRFSCILALSAPGTIAGVIGAGAGLPERCRRRRRTIPSPSSARWGTATSTTTR